MDKTKKIILTATCLLLLSVGFNGALAQTFSAKKAIKSNTTKEINNLNKFKKISISGSMNVIFTQSSEYSVVVDSKSESIIVDAVDDKLIIKRKTSKFNFRIDRDDNDVVYVSAPHINSFYIYGSGELIFKNDYKSDRSLNISLNGSGDIETKSIDVPSISISLSGSGDISVLGEIKAEDAKVTLSGSGDIEIKKIKSDVLDVKATSSGDIKIARILSTTVDSSLTGSGNIYLYGETDNANHNLVGSGMIAAKTLIANRVRASVSGSGYIYCYAKESIAVSTRGSGDIRWSGTKNYTKMR